MLLQDSKSAPLQYVKEYYSAKHMQQTCSLHEDTTTFIATFAGSHTHQSIKIIIYHRGYAYSVAGYMQHVINTMPECFPRFYQSESCPDQIWV